MSARRVPKVPPTPAEVLDALRAAGREATARIYRRHGADGEVWGVPYATLNALEKRIGRSLPLARALWASGVHDARALALKVCEPDALPRRELRAWLAAGTNHILMGHLGGLAARRRDGPDLARGWMDGRGEWVRAAGWAALAELAQAGRVEEAWGRELLARIEAEIHAAFNRERHCMNGALIALGGSLPGLREEAAAAAARIGRVEVDHGETGCKTPAAGPYMAKMWARKAAKA